MKKIKVCIIDDHPVVHDGIKMLCIKELDIDICCSIFDPRKAIETIEKKKPGVAIVDLSLNSNIGGIDLIKAIRDRFPKIKTLVLSMHDEKVYAKRAIRAGARGYIMKNQMTTEIVHAIREVAKGNLFLKGDQSKELLDEILSPRTKGYSDPLDGLTNRELDVFQLIGNGYSSKEIASSLNLSGKTIDTYKLRLKEKLNLKDNASLARYAIQWQRKQ